MVIPQQVKNRIALCSSNFTSGYVLKRVEIKDLKRYLYTHTYNMNETCGHYGKWNEPVTKRQIEYYSSYMRYLE